MWFDIEDMRHFELYMILVCAKKADFLGNYIQSVKKQNGICK